MTFDVAYATLKVAVSLSEVRLAELFDETLGIGVEAPWELNLLREGHLEDLVRIIRHERGSSIDELVHEDAEGVPVHGMRVALVLDDFWSDVLRCAAERVGPLMLGHRLDEAKVGKFDVSVVSHQDVLGFQISENQVLRVQVF